VSETPLLKKLKLKPGQRAVVLRPPPGYFEELGPLPDRTEMTTRLTGTFDWLQVFVKSKAELDALVPRLKRSLKPESLLWISFPKGTSSLQTDLTRDAGWDALARIDLKWVSLVSVDSTWSAFALRPYKPGEERKAPRPAPKPSE
jgi:hypothetical protein